MTRSEFMKSAFAFGAAVAAARWLGASMAEASADVVRPPGALGEDDFLSRCIRCQRCADACPNRCITAFSEASGKQFSLVPGPGQEGTPVIFPRRQACNLCASEGAAETLRCTDACPTGALRVVPKEREAIQASVVMGHAVVDENLCYSYTGSSCGVCVRACPFERDALRSGFFERPEVTADRCVGCGLCERSCVRYPQAITVVPSRERQR